LSHGVRIRGKLRSRRIHITQAGIISSSPQPPSSDSIALRMLRSTRAYGKVRVCTVAMIESLHRLHDAESFRQRPMTKTTRNDAREMFAQTRNAAHDGSPFPRVLYVTSRPPSQSASRRHSPVSPPTDVRIAAGGKETKKSPLDVRMETARSTTCGRGEKKIISETQSRAWAKFSTKRDMFSRAFRATNNVGALLSYHVCTSQYMINRCRPAAAAG
jgi:hypothetical protein